jgi:hypothetical protein
MQLFTEIEFAESEFYKIDEVLFILGSEGWNLINTVENKVIKPNVGSTIISKKFYFERYI